MSALVHTVGEWQAANALDSGLHISIHSGWSRRWSYAGRLADYVAAYFDKELAQYDAADARDVVAFLGYAVNEMVENAVKFGQGEQIDLMARLISGELTIIVSSRVAVDAAQRYQKVVEEIAEGDPLMLLMDRVERNAAEGPSAGSGLGLLSMMTDYGASLGWQFAPERDSEVAISTMARLPINKVGIG